MESDQPTMRVRLGKGAKDRVLPVHPEFREVLYSVVCCLPFNRLMIDASRRAEYDYMRLAVRSA